MTADLTRNGIPWELYRSFLAVARHGSLSAAARALQLTQPTLGRHVQLLERAVATPLFTRSPHGLLQTVTARALVPLAEAMEIAADDMARAACEPDDALGGVVRISADEVVGAEILPPLLSNFANEYSGITFELQLSNRTQDLLRREADIAVRTVRPSQNRLVARLLGQTIIGLHAHRGYLDIHGMPRRLADLNEMRLIGFDRDPMPVRALANASLQAAQDMFSLRTDNDLAQLAALRAGYGIGACQVAIARRDPDLVRVLPEMMAAPQEVWLVMHEDLRTNLRVRRLFDHLALGITAFLDIG